MKVQLVPLDELQAWDKNPRDRDPVRFEWIKVSLCKFGFQLPVYAREDGVLYSGHQRTSAARELGYDKAPVVFMKDAGDDRLDRGINILFNLCTNDHARKSDMGAVAALDLGDIEAFRALPDAGDRYPCMNWKPIVPAEYRDQLTELQVSQQTVGFALRLIELNAMIPVVMTPDGRIINGRPRLAAALKLGLLSYPAVTINDNADQLETLLNKITMSFDLEKVFGEALRYNSFFRNRNQKAQRTILGVGFYHWVFGQEANQHGTAWLKQHMTKLQGEFRSRFVREHGLVCVDFGAGRMDNTVKLEAAGITCKAFEPYLLRPDSDEITYAGARAVNLQFLRWVQTRPTITSVFCSSVFNSVPFKSDRDHLLVIFQALCLHGAKLYLTTLKQSSHIARTFGHNANKVGRAGSIVVLDSEPGLHVADILKMPKVQKFHSQEELVADGKRYFYRVEWRSANGGSHGIKCQQPREQDWPALVAALEFEFNLPYPGDRRMNLVNEAIAAFSAFTGEDLEKHRIRSK